MTDTSIYEPEDKKQPQKYLRVLVENLPPELKSKRAFCVWREETRDGKPTKVPYQSDLFTAGETNKWTCAACDRPKTWRSFNYTADRYMGYYDDHKVDGIGRFLTDDEDIVGIDIDKAFDENRRLFPWATEIIRRCNSYTEISPSGTGIRIFVHANKPGGKCKSPITQEPHHTKSAIEIYERDRYLTLTGHRVPTTPATIEPRQEAIDWLYHTYWANTNGNGQATKPQNHGTAPAELQTAIDVMCEDYKWAKLWEGDWSDYQSQSSADFALCGQLAYYLGGDKEKVREAFSLSGLGQRDKWQRRQDYQDSTLNACERDSYYVWLPDADEIALYISELEVPAPEPPKPDPHKPAVIFDNIDGVLHNAEQPEDWLIPEWLEFGSLAMLAGDPFSGKSFIMSEIYAGILKHGTFGPYAMPKCPIMLLDLENNDKKLKRRLGPAFNGDWDALRGWWTRLRFSEAVLPLEPPKIERFITHYQSVMKQDKMLVVIDTFRSAFAADEMDVKSTKELLYPLQRVAQRTNTAILILHHRPKNGARYSGQSSIPGALDYLWCWESNIETLCGKLSLEGTRGDPQAPIHFRLVNGRDMWQPEASDAQLEDIVRTTLTAFPDGLNQDTLVKQIINTWKETLETKPLGERTLRERLKGLVGSMVWIDQQGASHIYKLINNLGGEK